MNCIKDNLWKKNKIEWETHSFVECFSPPTDAFHEFGFEIDVPKTKNDMTIFMRNNTFISEDFFQLNIAITEKVS